MGFFDGLVDNFKKASNDLVNSRFNLVNQTRSAIALSKPVIQQGIRNVQQSKPSDYFLPTSRVGYTGLQQLPTLNIANKVKHPVRRFVANIGQEIVNTPIRAGQAVGRIGQDYAQGTTTAPRLIGNVATIAETPLSFATFGTGAVAKQLIKQGGKGAIRLAVKQGAKTGATMGGTFGLLQGLGENRDASNVFSQFLRSVPQAAGGAVVGGVLGGGISGGSAVINKLLKRTPQIEQQLRDSAGRWTAGETPVKPRGMPQAQWNFQLNFNKKTGRNPYMPVYPSDFQNEAEKRIGLQVRDINKDKPNMVVPLGRKSSPLVDPTTPQSNIEPKTLAQLPSSPTNPPQNPSSPDIINDPVQKIIQALKEAKPIRGEQEAIYSKARAQRVAKVASVGQKVAGEQGYYAQLGQLKGELPKVQFEGIRNKLTQEDINSVFDKVEQTPFFSPFEKVSAKSGLAKLLGKEGGAVPNESELRLLNEIFPPEFIKAAQGNRTMMQKILGGIGQAAALPRSLMAGGLDMSYGLRQGVFSGYSHPKQWASAFKEQFKYFGSEKAVQELNNSIKADPMYKLAREAGLSLTDLGAGKFIQREEQFQSALAEKIPVVGHFVRASGRAYTGFANKYRFDMFKSLVDSAKKTGDFNDPKFLKNAGELVNTLTGRGSLGKFEKQAGVLSSTLFSPRLLASRIQLMNPQFYLKLQPAVRKEALKSLVGYIAGTTTILGAAKMAGADVGTDPTNANFAKIKVGNTRVDIMGGFQQPMVLLARLLTGKLTSSTTGKTMVLGEGYKAANRFDIIQRFFESKEAPIVSFIVSLVKGKDAVGNDFNLPAELIDRMIPMFIADLVDLYKDGGLSSLPLGIPAFFGAGAQTYGKTEMVVGKNQLGETTSQVRPVQGLGESISSKIFGQQPLGTSGTTNVQSYYDQMLKMPRSEAAAKFDEIAKSNPDLAKKISQVAKDRQKGVTVDDQVLKAKGVESGDRATQIIKEFNNLKTTQEKAALWDHYVKVGIITKDVAKQLQGKLVK